jgi:CheY-like chemotaxis protein
VEDSPSDAKLLMRVLKHTTFTKAVHLVRTGQAAIDFIYRQKPYEAVPRPNLILLDLNLPRLSGFEVLRQLKAHDTYCVIPIIVMTTSADGDDILRCYQYHANSYIVKPNSIDTLQETVVALEKFWFTAAKLPKI